jgi:hypothetical protein
MKASRFLRLVYPAPRSLRAVRLFHLSPGHQASINGVPNVTGLECIPMRQPTGRCGATVPYLREAKQSRVAR